MNDSFGPEEDASGITEPQAPSPRPAMVEGYTQYAQRIPKIVNGLLAATALSDQFLLLSVGGGILLPDLGMNTLLLTCLLCFQNGLTCYVLNNGKLPPSARMNITDFHIGIVLGLVIGGTLLSFVLSHYYGQLSSCVIIETTSYTYQCNHRGKMLLIWFWAGLTFWLELATTFLIALAKEDLCRYARASAYETVGHDIDVDVDNTFQGFMPDTGAIFTTSRNGGHGDGGRHWDNHDQAYRGGGGEHTPLGDNQPRTGGQRGRVGPDRSRDWQSTQPIVSAVPSTIDPRLFSV